jgi:hypothetical protein
MVRHLKAILLTAFLLAPALAAAQQIIGPLQAQNNLSELVTNGTQATALSNLGGAPINSPVFTGVITGNGSGLTNLPSVAPLAANNVYGSLNGTVNVGLPLPACAAATSALGYTSGTGFSCNAAINAASLLGQTWAAPAAIGGTTAAAGSFTNLSSSGTVSGTGFTNYLASPPAIGGTAANAGTFTTLSTSGNVTVGGIISGNGSGLTNLPSAGLIPANNVYGSLTGALNTNLPVPGCTGSANALGYTTGTGFACNSTAGLISIQRFTSSGTYTPTPGTLQVIVEVQAGGGGSGGCGATGASQSCVSTSGGGGAFVRFYLASPTAVAITVGAAGAAGAAGNNAGGAGGNSSYGSVASCTGGFGGGGNAANSATSYTLVAAGSGTIGSCTLTGATLLNSAFGQSSSPGYIWGFSGLNQQSGVGGASGEGAGGAPTVSGGTAQAGTASGTAGGGASGAVSPQSQPAIGGTAGGAGLVMIYQYN